MKWGIGFAIVMFSIFILYLNILMPQLPGDDFLYALKFPFDGHIGHQKISSFGDVVESQINHYKNYNYRIAPHFILQILNLFPLILFKCLNTIVFFLLPYVVVRPFLNKLGNNIWHIYTLVLMIVWCFHFDLGRSYFWQTGSVNYCWVLIPQLVYLGNLYKSIRDNHDVKRSLIVLALVICTTNENVVLSLFLVSIGRLIYQQLIGNKGLDKTLLVATLILLSGGLLMLFSPSLLWRMEVQGGMFETVEYKLLEFSKRQMYYVIRFLPALLIVWSLKNRKLAFNKSWVFLAVIFISSISMLPSPLYEPRSSIFAFYVFIMFSLSTIEKFEGINKYIFFTLVIYCFQLCFNRLPLFQNVKMTSEINRKILENAFGKTDTIYLERFCTPSSRSCLACDEISSDPEHLDNKSLAAFYNVGKVMLNKNNSHYEKYKLFKNELLSESQVKNYELTRQTLQLTDEVALDSILVKRESEKGGSYVFAMSTKLEMPEDYTIILRGSKKRGIDYWFMDLFPIKVRLHFLDYLEEPNELIEVENVYYSYNYILGAENYKYFICSLYSKNNHTAIGKPFIMDIH